MQTLFIKQQVEQVLRVFAEAKSLNESRPENEKVWVIGVDRDQVAEGRLHF